MQNVAATLEGIVAFGGEHPLAPANTRATALYTQIGTTATSLRAHADDQDSGNADSAAERSPVAKRRKRYSTRCVRSTGSPRALPKSNGYAAFLSRANAFIEAVGPIKAAFVERGLPADFDEQLADKIAAITAATNSRMLGKAEQVGGTAG
jgi:predicted DNA-binding WGR domain protein